MKAHSLLSKGLHVRYSESTMDWNCTPGGVLVSVVEGRRVVSCVCMEGTGVVHCCHHPHALGKVLSQTRAM